MPKAKNNLYSESYLLNVLVTALFWTHHWHKVRKRRTCFSQHHKQTTQVQPSQWKLQTIDKFTYIGSTLSRNVLIDNEVDARIAKASTAFGRLHKNIWERQGLNLINEYVIMQY